MPAPEPVAPPVHASHAKHMVARGADGELRAEPGRGRFVRRERPGHG